LTKRHINDLLTSLNRLVLIMPISQARALVPSPSNAEQSMPALRQQGPLRAAADMAGDGTVDRRKSRSGNLGNRRTDNWMPYSTAFVAQLLAQQMDEPQPRFSENTYR
jgi:hypothetical protein